MSANSAVLGRGIEETPNAIAMWIKGVFGLARLSLGSISREIDRRVIWMSVFASLCLVSLIWASVAIAVYLVRYFSTETSVILTLGFLLIGTLGFFLVMKWQTRTPQNPKYYLEKLMNQDTNLQIENLTPQAKSEVYSAMVQEAASHIQDVGGEIKQIAKSALIEPQEIARKVIKRNPLGMILGGAAIGFFIAYKNEARR